MRNPLWKERNIYKEQSRTTAPQLPNKNLWRSWSMSSLICRFLIELLELWSFCNTVLKPVQEKPKVTHWWLWHTPKLIFHGMCWHRHSSSLDPSTSDARADLSLLVQELKQPTCEAPLVPSIPGLHKICEHDAMDRQEKMDRKTRYCIHTVEIYFH